MATSPTGFKVALLASEEDVRSAAATVLTNCSYEVFPVASVEDCLRLFTVRRIDIILAESSDLDVEARNNIQLTTVLKRVPLVLMTETDATNSLFQGLKIGAVDFLKRPLDESKVQSLWRHTLHKRLLSGGMVLEEGASTSAQRRPGLEECPTTGSKFPPLLSTHHSAPTGGSSINQTALLPTTVDPTRRTNTRPQNPTNVAEIPEPPSIVLPPQLTSPISPPRRSGQESQKRSLPSTTDQCRRRIRPNLMNQEIPVQTSSTASPSSGPPLLGIPPGCVPPVGSDGLAIGMPFLNQQPFVPAQPPMNLNNFPIPSAFLLCPDQDLQSGGSDQRSVFEASAMSQFPVVPIGGTPRPPTGMVPTSLATPLRSTSLQRVSSVPCTLTIESSQNTTNVSQGGILDAPDSSPDLLLRKSPSLINF